MRRTPIAALFAVVALCLPSSAQAVTTNLLAETGHNGTISLTEGSKDRGELKITKCANTSATALTCKGTGTVLDVYSGRVKIVWKCPVNKPCAKKAEGTLKNHGNVLGLLHVKASVPTFQQIGSQYQIVFEPTGE